MATARTIARTTEHRVSALVWYGDGKLNVLPGRGKNLSDDVSIGRADSRTTLGFEVKNGETSVSFVLDRQQVICLREYLRYQLQRLKGRR